MAKLTEEEVYRIRAEWDRGCRGKDLTDYTISPPMTYAKSYGITPSHYSMIGRRKRWSQLPERE